MHYKIKFFRICLSLLLVIFFFNNSYSYTNEPGLLEKDTFFIAKDAFVEGSYKEAIILFKRFIRTNPNSKKIFQAHLFIGQAYFYQNKLKKAIQEFEGIVNNKPESEVLIQKAFFWLGNCYFKLKDYKEAIQFYQELLSSFPESTYVKQALINEANSYFYQKSYNEAEAKFFKILNTYGAKDNSDIVYKVIQSIYFQKKYTQLKSFIEKIRKEKFDLNEDLLDFYLAESLYYLDNFTQAVYHYRRVIALTNDSRLRSLSNLGLGWAYLKLKDYDSAKGYFASVDTDYKDLEDNLLLGKAEINFLTGRYQDAIKIFDKIIRNTDKQEPLLNAYLGKAKSLCRLLKYEQALIHFKKAIKLIDDLPKLEKNNFITVIQNVYFGLSNTYLKLNNQNLARKALSDLFQRFEDNKQKVGSLFKIAQFWKDNEDFKQAAIAYNKIIKLNIDENSADIARYNIALAFSSDGQYKKAIGYLEDLKSRGKDNSKFYNLDYDLGLLYFKINDYVKAKKNLSAFIEKQDIFTDSKLNALYYLGRCDMRLSNYNKAIDIFSDIINVTNDVDVKVKSQIQISLCLDKLGKTEEAINLLKIASIKNPQSLHTPDLYYYLAQFYYSLTNLELAKKYLHQLMQRFRDYSHIAYVHYLIGCIYNIQGSYNNALAEFKKTVSFKNKDLALAATLEAGKILTNQARYKEAIDYYEYFISEVFDRELDIFLGLAGFFLELKDYSKSVQNYKKAYDLADIEERSQIKFKIAQCYQEQGNLDLAIKEFAGITKQQGTDSSLRVKAYLRIAKIFEEKNNWVQAVVVYKKLIAMRIDESKYAEERLRWIRQNINDNK